MKIEEVVAWQKARVLTRRVYQKFRGLKDFGFRDQITRAVLSIMNNIAEGIESRTKNELTRYFSIAKASTGEVRSMLYAAYDLKYINHADFKELNELLLEEAKIIAGFLRKI